MTTIRSLYRTLFSEYGHQGWWPLYNKKTGKIEYHQNDYSLPKNKEQSFEIGVGAILTQNTSWKNVEKALLNLYENNLLQRDIIMDVSEKKLAGLIRPVGYFNQKAKKLKIFANFKDEINRENLLNLWGIGKETADSILCYAHNKKIFVVDAYTQRIFTRLGFKDSEYDEIQQLVMDELLDIKELNEFHALLVELGKNTCKKEPLCGQCCLKKVCAYGQGASP